METKPHLVLFWTFDIPNYRLYIDLDDECTYEAIEGGTKGYTKTYKGEVTHITPYMWESAEKFWISENYGDRYGYYQPDPNRIKKHPKYGWDQVCRDGFGPDGEYLDHMQRMQIVLEAQDVAHIFTASDFTVFETPDCGLTIFKRVPTTDVNYPEEMKKGDAVWPEWQQACLMQPRTRGPRISSHEELIAFGCPEYIVDRCKAGEWDAPAHPELQKYYIYPTH